MFVAPREGLLVRPLLVSDSLVRLFGSSGFESGSERSRFPWLASIAVFLGRIWDVLAGWLGGDLGAAPNTHLGCALGCSERTLVVSVASMLCLWFVLGLSLMCLWCVSGVSSVRLWLVSGLSLVCLWLVSGLSLVCLWLVLSVCPITSEYLLPSICRVSAEYLSSICRLSAEYLPIVCRVSVWFVCTVTLDDLLETLEQEKRSSPKTLCRGPNGVLTNPVFDLLVCAL